MDTDKYDDYQPANLPMTALPPSCTAVPGRLSGRVGIVTGGGSGIGRATCARLAAEGARVVVADIDSAKGEKVAQEIGNNAVFVQLDVSQHHNWQAATHTAVAAFGSLDILVNCAAIARENTIENTTLDAWRETLAINVDGTFFGCQAAVAVMKNQRGGAIVNLSSTAGYQGAPDLFAYVASKGAVRALTKEVAAYCGARGYPIRCNSVHPAVVDTPMVSAIFEANGQSPSQWTQAQAIKRMASADEIAAMIAFLVSEESSFATGADFVIDGGLLSGGGVGWE